MWMVSCRSCRSFTHSPCDVLCSASRTSAGREPEQMSKLPSAHGCINIHQVIFQTFFSFKWAGDKQELDKRKQSPSSIWQKSWELQLHARAWGDISSRSNVCLCPGERSFNVFSPLPRLWFQPGLCDHKRLFSDRGHDSYATRYSQSCVTIGHEGRLRKQLSWIKWFELLFKCIQPSQRKPGFATRKSSTLCRGCNLMSYHFTLEQQKGIVV